MPDPRDEPADAFSLLQKQLILSQVQILELEDVRDELKASLADRARVLTELQTLADRALGETQQAQATALQNAQALTAAQDEARKSQAAAEALKHEVTTLKQRLVEAQNALEKTHATIGERTARLETLDGEMRTLKNSRSWRWTAPLRALERLFR